MFGAGSSDAKTLPSTIAKKTNRKGINFGESGYIARQSLAMLNNQYIQNINEMVI